MDNFRDIIRKMFPGDEKWRRPVSSQDSKHMLPKGIRSTKKYADSRQKSSANRIRLAKATKRNRRHAKHSRK